MADALEFDTGSIPMRRAIGPDGHAYLLPANTDLKALGSGIPASAIPVPTMMPVTATERPTKEKEPARGMVEAPPAGTPVTPKDVEGLLMGASVPLLAAGGGGATALGLPAWAGRIAMSGALGGGKALAEGKGGERAATEGALDAGAAGVAEAALGAVTRGVKIPGIGKIGIDAIAEPLTNARRGFEYYTGELRHALDLVKNRLPKGAWLNVPALSNARLTVEQAIEGLVQSTGNTYKLALAQMASQLNDAERTLVRNQVKNIPRPYAGSVLKSNAPDVRFRYEGTGAQKAADVTARGLRDNVARSAADAGSTADTEVGLPAGVVGATALGRYARGLVGQ